jgi:Tfp pilus assembly protein PilN
VNSNADPCLLLLLLLLVLVLHIVLLSDVLGLGRPTATQARTQGTLLQAHTAAAAGKAAVVAAAMAAAAAGTARPSLCAQLGQQQAAGKSCSDWQMQVMH